MTFARFRHAANDIFKLYGKPSVAARLQLNAEKLLSSIESGAGPNAPLIPAERLIRNCALAFHGVVNPLEDDSMSAYRLFRSNMISYQEI